MKIYVLLVLENVKCFIFFNYFSLMEIQHNNIYSYKFYTLDYSGIEL